MAEDPERVRQRARDYYWSHRVAVLQQKRIKRQDDQYRALLNERVKQWRDQNPERVAQTAREWARQNPIKRVFYEKSRRARLKGCIDTLTYDEWLQVLEDYDYRCAYSYLTGCTDNDKLTIDHVIPLVLGGSNSKENIAPACLSCNSKKHISLWQPQRLS